MKISKKFENNPMKISKNYLSYCYEKRFIKLSSIMEKQLKSNASYDSWSTPSWKIVAC